MFPTMFKWLSVSMLCVTVYAFYSNTLPPYITFTEYDRTAWIFCLGMLAMWQTIFLVCKMQHCYKCRVWSDFILQLTGLAYIILSSVFGAMYPPFTWAMGVFPIIGVLYLVVGRSFSQRSRQCLREYNGTTTTH